MLINLHSFYSLRWGTLPLESLARKLAQYGYDAAVLTDINNTSGALEFVKYCREVGIRGYVGVEFRDGDQLLYIGIAKNNAGFAELNELLTDCNLTGKPIPKRAPDFNNVFVIYPFGRMVAGSLRENEFIGVQASHITKVMRGDRKDFAKYLVWKPATFEDEDGFILHRQLRAINHNILLSQLQPTQCAGRDESLCSQDELLKPFKEFPQIIKNTEWLLSECNFSFDYNEVKNRKTYTGSGYDDKMLLQQLAMDGWKQRYGTRNSEALLRLKKELAIIDTLGFSAYFLTTWDIIRYSMNRGFYHVGRGSGANSVVAYCLRITDVCPMELDLYFERFLNPKRKSPPDFDIDYSWKDRDDVFAYIFNRYRGKNTALLGATSTFRDRSIIRELGKVYGLPKGEIDRLIDEPGSVQNKHEITDLILSVYNRMADFPNNRTIHAGGVLISELPLSNYVALDLPPKGYPVVQFDMYTAEAIGFEKLDILSQRGIGHIQECAEIIRENRMISVDVHNVAAFKKDDSVAAQLKSGDTIGCFYIESPAMRWLLKKLRCSDFTTLVAASSIIRPGVAKSGMMKSYIERFHHPDNIKYLHPVMKEQLSETYGVMVYQEDVLKIGHHFGGLDLADADVLRRLMSGKNRGRHHLVEIEAKFFANCKEKGYNEQISREVWRQIESFAGYSFSKAHSASYAVESYQSLYLKTYYPLEFCTAVINNFGGFYPTRVYVNEAQRGGGTVHLPCVNQSKAATSIKGTDIHLGFVHIQGLEVSHQEGIPLERVLNGPYKDLEDVISRNQLGLEQATILIRVGAMRFTRKSKKTLLWEAHSILSESRKRKAVVSQLFEAPAKTYELPHFDSYKLEDAYDEIELLGFPLTMSLFDMAKSDYRGEANAASLMSHVGKTVRMVGNFITRKHVRTVRGQEMNFGTFLDDTGAFFDTVHFPPCLQTYPFKGAGVYLVEGKVVEDFGFPSIEVSRFGKMPIKADPRSQ